MDRRRALVSLGALAAGMALDPERLLWVPGRRTYFDVRGVRLATHAEIVDISLDYLPAGYVRGIRRVGTVTFKVRFADGLAVGCDQVRR